MVLLKAVGAAEYANSQGKLEKFCNDNGLRHKAVIESRKLRMQLTNEIKNNVPDAEIIVDPKLEPPTDLQVRYTLYKVVQMNRLEFFFNEFTSFAGEAIEADSLGRHG